VRALGRNLSESMHPATMVSTARRADAPIVTIMPYFFTRMALPGTPIQAVWPEDGAIVSPVFMLAKQSRRAALQPVIDFFASRELGEILAHKGLFPSTHPEVDNRLEPGRTFDWLGWDYIRTQDIPALIARCQALFAEGQGATAGS
jgi:ABC-type Fe3+ transport system substrate-binding protein